MKTMRIFTILSLLIFFTFSLKAQQNQNPTQNVCAGATENYNVTTALTGSTFAWTITPASGGTVVGTGNNININWGTTPGTYTVQVTETSADNCVGDPKSVDVTIIAAPLANAGTPQTICAIVGTTISLSAATASNYSALTWSGGSGATAFTSTTTLNPTYTITAADITAGTITLQLVATAFTPCNNATSTVTFTINAAPTLTVSNNGPVCANSTLSLTSSIPGATYSWTGPNGYTSTSQNPTVSANATAAMAGTYSLTVSGIAGGCPNLSGTTTVIVNPKPNTSSIWHN